MIKYHPTPAPITHSADRPLHIPHLARELPSGWRWCMLDDVCEGVFDCPHSTPILTSDGPYVVRTQDILTGTFRTDQAAHVSDETYQDRIRRAEPRFGDLLFSREGTYFGIAAEVPKDIRVCLGQRMVLLRPVSTIVDAKFLKYWLNGPILASHVNGQRDGTVAERLNMPTIRALPFPVPPLKQQRRISEILSTLDDKIDLNRSIIKTLEAITRRLFQSWFVDFDPVHAKVTLRRQHPNWTNTQVTRAALPTFAPDIADLFADSFDQSTLGPIPKGWSQTVLHELINSVIGGDWGKDAPDDHFTEAVLCIRGADIPDLQTGGIGKMPTRYIKASSLRKRRMAPGDIAFEISGGSPTQSTGRAVLATEAFIMRMGMPVTCSNFCRLIRPTSNVSSLFLYQYLCWLYGNDDFLQYENGTTGIKNLSFTPFSSLHPFLRPPEPLMKAFDQTALSLFAKRDATGLESSRLAITRDALLPKLLAGEIDMAEH